MSVNQICPPPPPSPISVLIIIKERVSKPKEEKYSNICTSLCVWASEYSELQYACQRFDVCITREPFNYTYKYFESLLQDGPMCGLVAISMLLNKTILPLDLLSIARDKGYSNNGELFSVKNAHSLLQTALDLTDTSHTKIEIQKNKLFSTDVISSLLDGCVILVPYDSGRNHSPCLKRGHKAHWGLVTGIIITSPQDPITGYHPDSVFVAAKHGKSLHLGLWRLKDLEDSNQNLVEFSPDRGNDPMEYVVPECGLDGEDGLKGQFILIHPTSK